MNVCKPSDTQAVTDLVVVVVVTSLVNCACGGQDSVVV
jgi:preprotein translocase subunit SecE